MPDDIVNVLIIDDEAGLRSMLKFGLEKRGYTVVGAANGEEGLTLARQKNFDLAVCDIMMPGMSGVEVLKALTEISPTTEVIMATGHATLETAIETMKAGAFDYITKPYTLGHLCAIFDKAIEHRRLKAKVVYLEELDRLKSEFVSTMSHELRTPLASTMGYLSLVRRGVYGPVTEAQKTALDRAELNAKNLLSLINSVLDLSKLQAQRMTTSSESVALDEVTAELAASMEPLAKAKKLDMVIEGARGLQIITDRGKLRQILTNLVGNAIKFTKTGRITVAIDAGEGGHGAVFHVRDTGMGIARGGFAEVVSRIPPNRQLVDAGIFGDRPRLAISKRLTELLGGTISVQSAMDVGTDFQVTLPDLPDAQTPARDAPAATAAQDRSRVILAIDDEPDVLKLLRDSLTGTGFQLVSAQNGTEGLALARQVKPCCITLDIMMPNMSGWDVLHALKNDPELQQIPVYIVSVADEKAKAFALGVTGYIHKPFTRDDLITQLRLIPRKTQQVMVIDDDAQIRDILSTALSAEGYEVITAPNGEEALARIKTLNPDILFLDLVLPGMSGFDVLVALDEQPNRAGIAIFVMTGKDLSQEERDYLTRRAHLVIQKGSHSLSELIDLLKIKISTIRAVA